MLDGRGRTGLALGYGLWTDEITLAKLQQHELFEPNVQHIGSVYRATLEGGSNTDDVTDLRPELNG